jgi:hypothetical protein
MADEASLSSVASRLSEVESDSRELADERTPPGEDGAAQELRWVAWCTAEVRREVKGHVDAGHEAHS